MHRTSVRTATAALLVGAVAVASGAAAQPAGHGKTKVLKGTYQVMAPPDPTVEATDQAGMNCHNVDPLSANEHSLKLPAKGFLKVDLTTSDPTGHLDWDLYLLDQSGTVIGSSTGASSNEEIAQPVGKGSVIVKTCNLAGEPTATVTWALTYKK